MAHSLLHYAPAGPVTDLLYAQCPQSASRLAHTPSDKVLFAARPTLTLTDLVDLVCAVDSEAFLEACAKDKRVGVRIAVAANRATPPHVRRTLAKEALTEGRPKLAEAIMEGARGREYIELAVGHRHLRGDQWINGITNALQFEKDNALVEIVAAGVQEHHALQIADQLVAWDHEWINADALQSLLGTSSTPGVERADHNVIGRLLSIDGSTQRQDSLRAQVGGHRADPHLLRLAALGKGTNTVQEILARSDTRTQESHLALLVGAEYVFTLEDAALLADSDAPVHLHRRLRATPEAQQVLAGHSDPVIAGTHLGRVEDIQAQNSLLRQACEDALVNTNIEPARLEALWQAGLELPLVETLLQHSRHRDVRPLLRDHLVAHSTSSNILARLRIDSPDAEALLGRSDLDIPDVNHYLGLVLPKDNPSLRQALLEQMLPATAADVVRNHGLGADEVDFLLEVSSDQEALLEALTVACEGVQWRIEEWQIHLVPRMPLARLQRPGALVNEAAARLFTSEFGDNTEEWSSALVLYPQWTGTLSELVDTVRML